MSCPHGNWGACDACDDIDNAYASGAKQIASLTEQNERLRGKVAAMQAVVNAASICDAAWNSDDDERKDCMDEEFALSEALEAYRAALKSVTP